MNDKETTTGAEDDWVQSEADRKVAKLDADTERINQAIAENANAKAQAKLHGVAEAGQTPVKKTKEETITADAKEFFKGTALEKDIEKANE